MTTVDTIKSVLAAIYAARPELALELELDPSGIRALIEEVAERAEIPVPIASVMVRDVLSMHPAKRDDPAARRGTVRDIPALPLEDPSP
jgi:hypothetical protein